MASGRKNIDMLASVRESQHRLVKLLLLKGNAVSHLHVINEVNLGLGRHSINILLFPGESDRLRSLVPKDFFNLVRCRIVRSDDN